MAGEKANPTILEYFAEAGRSDIKSDEIPWCSAFLIAMTFRCGLNGSRSLSARSWLAFGEKISSPQPGDIAVFWRESEAGSLGHVGIYIAELEQNLLILGGNESNRVMIEAFPTRRLLGFRRLS